LMWRNVYHLPQDARLDEFNLEILRKKGDKGVKYNDQDSLFSSILGVTDKKGKPYTENEELFDFERKHMIFPPWKIYSGSLKDTINNPFNKIFILQIDINHEIQNAEIVHFDIEIVTTIYYFDYRGYLLTSLQHRKPTGLCLF
ncbi:unnamed protein product, partial [marine sediment metagenome]